MTSSNDFERLVNFLKREMLKKETDLVIKTESLDELLVIAEKITGIQDRDSILLLARLN